MLISGGELCCAHIGRDGEVKDVRPMGIKWLNQEEVQLIWPNGIYKNPLLAPISKLEMKINNQFYLSVDIVLVEFVVDINGEPTTFKFIPAQPIHISGPRTISNLSKKYLTAAEAIKKWEEGREEREFKKNVWWADMTEKGRQADAEKREQKNAYNKTLDCFVRPKMNLFEELQRRGFMQ